MINREESAQAGPLQHQEQLSASDPDRSEISRGAIVPRLLHTFDSVETYCRERVKLLNIVAEPTFGLVKAEDFLARVLAEEIRRVRSTGYLVECSDPHILEMAKKAYAIYAEDLLKTNVTCQLPIFVAIDPHLRGNWNVVKGVSRVVTINPHKNSVSAEVLAHEFGHAGAAQTFLVAEGRYKIVSSGLLGNDDRFGLLEELASMTFNLAVLQDRNALVRKPVSLIFSPEHINNEALADLAPFIERLAKCSADADRADGKLAIPFSKYQNLQSMYASHCVSMDRLAEEAFPSLLPQEAAQAIRGLLQKGQATGSRRELEGVLRGTFGEQATQFLTSLGRAKFTDGKKEAEVVRLEELYFILFERFGALLPGDEAQRAREELVSTYFSKFPLIEQSGV